nr:(2Fe-2S)-binding protein [Erythrobacter sp. KY5]
MKLEINGQQTELGEVDPDMPLLWALRDVAGLVGTKFGCGIAQCGACTVHVDGYPQRSCQLPIGSLEGQSITTIEGLAEQDGTLSALQQAWIDYDVPQCGYCQAGQLMSAAALLDENANPTDEEIDAAMAGNYCRCGTYVRIKGAIKSVASGEAMLPKAGGSLARGA